MGIKNNTNKERITYQAKGTELSTDHYRRLMKQREVYRHPSLPIVVVRTNYNRTIKFIDAIRMVELRIFRGSYPYLVLRSTAEAYAWAVAFPSNKVHLQNQKIISIFAVITTEKHSSI